LRLPVTIAWNLQCHYCMPST